MNTASISSCFSLDVIAMPTLNIGRQPTQRQEAKGRTQISTPADLNTNKPMTWNEISHLVENDDSFAAIAVEEYERFDLTLAAVCLEYLLCFIA